ncbi:hypothetical protein Bbelb_061000 [Branchiostoma belcheri]|nr:hypothetical protein Bbelb_061000 [Branchiostoma belcheri]
MCGFSDREFRPAYQSGIFTPRGEGGELDLGSVPVLPMTITALLLILPPPPASLLDSTGQGAGGSGTDAGQIRATAPMWRCSRIMHMQRDLHPTLLSSLEGIVDQITPLSATHVRCAPLTSVPAMSIYPSHNLPRMYPYIIDITGDGLSATYRL